MEEIVFCPKCQHPNKKGAEYCENCGARLSPSPEESSFANVSGAETAFEAGYNDSRRTPKGPLLQVITKPKAYTFSIAIRLSFFLYKWPIIIDMCCLLLGIVYLVIDTLTQVDPYGMDFILIAILMGLDILSILNYLVFLPMRMVRTSKAEREEDFQVQIYSDAILYSMAMNTPSGKENYRQKVLEEDVERITEYKDIFILSLSVYGRRTAFVLIKESLNDAALEAIKKWKARLKKINGR